MMFAWRDLEKMYLFHMLQVQRAFRVAVILHDATMYYSIGRNIPWSSTNQSSWNHPEFPRVHDQLTDYTLKS
jgi:hypothetical protein